MLYWTLTFYGIRLWNIFTMYTFSKANVSDLFSQIGFMHPFQQIQINSVECSKKKELTQMWLISKALRLQCVEFKSSVSGSLSDARQACWHIYS